MLSVKNVTKRYGNFTALENIELAFTPGVYGLLAPNGAGKTTLMKMLTTLTFPSEGEILWDGTEIGKLGSLYREKLGYLPQQMGYYPQYTPRQYLNYLSALKSLDRRTAERRIPELLELVGLSDVCDKKMKKFSGGMIQRVGIAQALLNEPKLLILDEPTSGLDPKERGRFRNILSGLSRDCIVILSTHIVSDVESVANELIFLKDKRVFLTGSAQELCRRLDGMVFETSVPDGEVDDFERTHFILSRRQEQGYVSLRFTGGEVPAGTSPVAPTLEDVFLTTYR